MAHPQNSPRGTFAKSTVYVGQTALTSPVAGVLAATGLSTIPSADRGIAFGLVSNSTGVALVVNSTGTTWKYLNTTSIQPT